MLEKGFIVEQTVTSKVANILREEIVSGRLAPSTRITVKEISDLSEYLTE